MGPRELYEGRSEAATLELTLQLPFDAGQVYGFLFKAPGHRPAWQLIRRQDFLRSGGQVEVDDIVLRLMLLPDAPGMTDLPQGYNRLKELASPFTSDTGITAEAYQGMDVAAQMAEWINYICPVQPAQDVIRQHAAEAETRGDREYLEAVANSPLATARVNCSAAS